MNNILEGYFPDEVIAQQLGYTVRSIRRIRSTCPDAPAYIRVKRRPMSTLQAWREYFERATRRPNPRRRAA